MLSRLGMPGHSMLKISVITPSFNQAQYLEMTMMSVSSQTGCELEYIVIDGGSTDGSADIIRRYSSRLSYWLSEPDNGQYFAIQKGLQRATGDVLCWLNSDDILLPNALAVVAKMFQDCPSVEWITA